MLYREPETETVYVADMQQGAPQRPLTRPKTWTGQRQ